MDLGRGGGSSSSGAGARSGAGVGVAAAGVSDRPSCTAAPPCDFLFLVACSFLAAARAGSFRFFSIATGRGRVEARMALSEVCTTPSGAHWHRGQEGVGVESRRQLIRGELLELCLSRRDEATGGQWMVCGREAGWKCRENGLTKVGPPRKKMEWAWPARARVLGDRQAGGTGHWDWGIVPLLAPGLSGAVVWCGAGLASLQGADWTGGPRPSRDGIFVSRACHLSTRTCAR